MEKPIHSAITLQQMESTFMISMQRFYIYWGIDHERLTYKYQRRFRLTDVHGKVVNQILS